MGYYRGTISDMAIQEVMDAIFNRIEPGIGKIVFSQPSNPNFSLTIDVNPTVLVQVEKITIGQFKPVKVIPSLVPIVKPTIEEPMGIIKGLSPIILRMVSGKKQQLTLTFVTYVSLEGKGMTPLGPKVEVGGIRLNDVGCELRWGWMKLVIIIRTKKFKKRTLKYAIDQVLPDFNWIQHQDVIIFSKRSVFEGLKPSPTPSFYRPKKYKEVRGPPGKYKEPEEGYEFEKL